MEKTLFEKIIDREIGSTIEYEDDDVIAIRDIAPSAPLHLLIITKKVIPSAHHITSDDAALISRVYYVAQQLAAKFGVDKSGYRIVTNVNADAGQTIYHLHFHLLGGEPLGRMNSSSIGHATSSSPRGTLRDAGLMLLAAIGLAVGFNMMNPHRIDWVKKEYDRVGASDDELTKYMGNAQQTTDEEERKRGREEDRVKSEKSEIRTNDLAVNDANKRSTDVASADEADKRSTDVASADEARVKSLDANTKERREMVKFVPEPGIVKEINKRQFTALMNAGPYYLIDARTPEAFAKGHIKNANNIYGAEAESRIPDILDQVPRDRVILIYCDGGECELSHHVADVLKSFGYGPIFIFTGGWAEWQTR